jgi:predicted esterase
MPGADHGPVLLVPPEPPPGPLPLIVLFHGATSTPRRVIPFLRAAAERRGTLIWAPKSVGATWDAIRTPGFGPDAAALVRAFDTIARRHEIDPERTDVAGFSDGASYALMLGLAWGDRFRRILAFSPGFVRDLPRVGRPSVFISHGTSDPVLPIDRTSRRIVPALRAEGYDVEYHEFAGGHEITPEAVAAALGPA